MMRTMFIAVACLGMCAFAGAGGFVAASGVDAIQATKPVSGTMAACSGTGATSETCATWFAADVAADAAYYSWWQAIFALAATAAASVALILTARANDISRRSFELAAGNSRVELRAYVSSAGIQWERMVVHGQPHIFLRPVWRNSGQTPAQSVSVKSILTFGQDDANSVDSGLGPSYDIGAALETGGSQIAVNESLIFSALNDQRPIYLTAIIKYSDVFKDKDESLVRYLLRFGWDGNKGLVTGSLVHLTWETV